MDVFRLRVPEVQPELEELRRQVRKVDEGFPELEDKDSTGALDPPGPVSPNPTVRVICSFPDPVGGGLVRRVDKSGGPPPTV